MIKKLCLILACSVILSSCGPKNATTQSTPTPIPRTYEMPLDQRPYISLVPREDGKLINLKVVNIPDNVTSIEYELLYNAVDNGNEIEKGVGDTIKNITKTFEKAVLLGTESCTNGCKYKYDEGVIGGNLSINFITKDNQIAQYTTPFTLKTASDIKKSGQISLVDDGFTIKTTPSGKLFYILLKNYNQKYSVFSSALSTEKFVSTNPDTQKTEKTLTGDYQIK